MKTHKTSSKSNTKGRIDVEFVEDSNIPDAEARIEEGIDILVDVLIRAYRKRHSKSTKDLILTNQNSAMKIYENFS